MTVSPALAGLVAAFFEGREDVIADPYPLYARMRDEAPVFRHQHMYLVTRHDDVAALIRDDRLGSRDHNRIPSALAQVEDDADREVVQAWGDFLITFLAGTDEPDHMRRRKFQQHGFLPKQLDDVVQYTQNTMDSLLDTAAAKGDFDFFEEIAHVLPSQVIAHMLGVPEEDMGRVRDWTGAAGWVMGRGYQHIPEVRDQLDAYKRYVVEHIARRRREPHRDDLLGILIAAEEDGEKLTPDELTVTFFNLIFSGHESTATAIVTGMYALLRHPNQWRLLCDKPELVAQATEELLRYVSPVQSITRYARVDIELEGGTIPAGSSVKLMLGAANHDPTHFPDPETLDILREDTKSLVFGRGTHFCMGNALARLETSTALGTVARRFPQIRLAGDAVRWRENPLMHRPLSLWVSVPRLAAPYLRQAG
jgi:cytochrome P450